MRTIILVPFQPCEVTASLFEDCAPVNEIYVYSIFKILLNYMNPGYFTLAAIDLKP